MSATAAELEIALGGALPPVVECCSYLNRIATLLQLRDGIGKLHTRIPAFRLPAWRVRVLAVIMSEVVHYITAGTDDPQGIGLLVAIAPDASGRWLTMAVGAQGEFGGPVSSLEATTRMRRAAAMADLLGGELRRGYEGDRLVFGVSVAHRIYGRYY